MYVPKSISPASTWPITGDVPDLQSIVHEQARTITQQEALLHAYQVWLNTEQTPPASPQQALGTGTASGTPATTLAIANVTQGPILIGSTIAGAGVPAGTTLVSQQTGLPGSAGNYTTSQATTANSAPLTFTPPPNPMPWPTATDAPTLLLIQQDQTAIIRTQTALLQQYVDLLNTSATPPPTTGP